MKHVNRHTPRTLVALLAITASAVLAGCADEPVEEQTFVSLEHAAQWIVDHECDSYGAQQGEYGISMEGRPIQMIFACDNGLKFDVGQLTSGDFRAKPLP